jgi:hypothetical protein
MYFNKIFCCARVQKNTSPRTRENASRNTSIQKIKSRKGFFLPIAAKYMRVRL